MLWPLFHYLLDQIRLQAMEWEQYQAGDRIWVYDYRLCLVPTMVREKLPERGSATSFTFPFPPPMFFRRYHGGTRCSRGFSAPI